MEVTAIETAVLTKCAVIDAVGEEGESQECESVYDDQELDTFDFVLTVSYAAIVDPPP
jgi:hypothetical protein